MNLTIDEYDKCIKTLTTLAESLDADLANIDELIQLDINKTTESNAQKVSHFMLRKRPKSVQDVLEVRVAVVGNVDAGKVKRRLFSLDNIPHNLCSLPCWEF